MAPRLLLFALLTAAACAPGEDMVFPADAGHIDVKAQFGAKGDGVTDDTAAIQKAIDESKGKPGTLYFPNGTYLVSAAMSAGGVPHSRDRFLNYQGQSEAGTVIRLKDACAGFGDPLKPKIVLALYNGQGTGDAMHGYVNNLSVDVGSGNPGAIGLRFMSNNTGAMNHVTIRSSDPARAGKIGLDMRQGQNGPNLVRKVTVIGFDHGIETGSSFSLVFEHITLKEQKVAGFVNNSRTTIRKLTSVNRVPALINDKNGGDCTLIEADLSGGDSAATAIINRMSKVFLRDITQSGYGHLLQDSSGKTIDGKALAEWYDGKANALFASETTSLRLPIKETPEVPWETDLSKWVKIDGAAKDDTAAVQAAFDQAAKENKTTVYFPKAPQGTYTISANIRVHGSVNRIVGMENLVDVIDPTGAMEAGGALFTFADLTSDALVVERFFLLGGWKSPPGMYMFENRSGKAIAIRNVNHNSKHKKLSTGGGEWFIEDVSPGRTSTLLIGPDEKCWARQYNPESPKADMIDVDGGKLWVLGLKTEGRSTHIIARNGASVEVLGGMSYQSWGNQPLDPPMFKVNDANLSVTIGFYHYKTPFTTIVEETAGGETRTLLRKDLTNYHLSIFRATRGAKGTGTPASVTPPAAPPAVKP